MYYKIRMLNKDNLQPYHVYVSAFDKAEAKQMVRNELLDEEKEDMIDAIIEISEKEYAEGYRKFGDGVRE